MLLLGFPAGAALAARAASFSWVKPVPVDNQPPFVNGSAGRLSALSCPLTGLCVAASSTNLVSWSNPGHGQPAVKLVSGSDQRCDPEVPEYPCYDLPVTGISCPSATFCAEAYGGSYEGTEYGDVLIVMDPGGRASTLPGGGTGESGLSVVGVSCASTALCVAVDDGGNVFSSTDPASASPKWTSAKVSVVGAFGAVSCPSMSLCVAVDDAGDVVSSSDPAGGASAWTVAQVERGHRLTGISCASASLCVAADGAGDVVSSSDPTGGASAWVLAHIDSSALIGVSCPSASLCVTLDSAGNAISSSDPTAGAASWTAYRVGGYNILTQVTCPGRTLCVAVDDAGNVVSSRDPTSAAARWTLARVDPGHALSGVSCATASLCLADDAKGRVFGSGNPAGGARAWKRVRSPPLAGVSCASVRRGAVCFGVERSLFVSTQPLRGRWRREIIPRGVSSFVSCALRPQLVCFGLGGQGGLLFSSTDPAVGPRAWRSHRGPFAASLGEDSPLGLWCPSARLCIAAAELPFGPSDSGDCLNNGLQCSLVVEASTDPISARPAWRTVALLEYDSSAFAEGAVAVSCPSASLCFLLNGSDPLSAVLSLISTDPDRAWRRVRIERGGGATSVACPSARVCIAVDDRGNVIRGRRA